MSGPEDTDEARELKAILCTTCYASLIQWITGKSTTPYVPCRVCVTPSEAWLRARRFARGAS